MAAFSSRKGILTATWCTVTCTGRKATSRTPATGTGVPAGPFRQSLSRTSGTPSRRSCSHGSKLGRMRASGVLPMSPLPFAAARHPGRLMVGCSAAIRMGIAGCRTDRPAASGSGLAAACYMEQAYRRTRPNSIQGRAMRTEIGRPNASMRLRAWTATFTSVARRSSARERSPFPITCFHRNRRLGASAFVIV
jgi:hypothetical protein